MKFALWSHTTRMIQTLTTFSFSQVCVCCPALASYHFHCFSKCSVVLPPFSHDLPNFLQRDSADIFRSRAVLTQGSELRVNNAGTQRKKEISEGVRHSTEA